MATRSFANVNAPACLRSMHIIDLEFELWVFHVLYRR